MKDHDFKNLMQLMLSKNQTQRFYKLEQIQSHIWFKDFSWDDLISLNLEPAFVPKIDINENQKKIEEMEKKIDELNNNFTNLQNEKNQLEKDSSNKIGELSDKISEHFSQG